MVAWQQNLTLEMLRFELEEAKALLGSLREGLSFIAGGDKRRLIYLVDYPEIHAYWNARSPLSRHDLKRDGVADTWQYLTNLERIFLNLANDDEELVGYLRRAYEEQAEYIDALLLTDEFATIISPPAFSLLKDSIAYFAHYARGATENWQSAILQNDASLNRILEESTSFSEKLYIEDTEQFGFASLAREPASSKRDILLSFLSQANFYDAADFPWEHQPYELPNAQTVSRALDAFDPNETRERWLEWIDTGNDRFNESYAKHGHWARRDDGAYTLAFLDYINRQIGERSDNLQVALITRNRQYFQALSAMRSEGSGFQGALPIILHPRLVSAFMIRQGGEIVSHDRVTLAHQGNEALEELLEYINFVGDFLKTLTAESRADLSTALKRFVRKQLHAGWTQYRKLSLAEQIKTRIQDREQRWKNIKNSKIREYLQQIIEHELLTIQFGREIALLKALPNESNLRDYSRRISGVIVKADGVEDRSFLYVKSNSFYHLFSFRSRAINDYLKEQSSREIKISDAIDRAIETAEIAYGAGRADTDDDKEDVRLLRFDVLLFISILYAANNQLPYAKIFLQHARRVGPPNSVHRDGRLAQQEWEAHYLEGLLDRLEWRRKSYDKTPKEIERHMDEGLEKLHNLKSKSSQRQGGGEVDQNIRYRVLCCAFARELYNFAASEKLTRDESSWALSIDECIMELDKARREAVEMGSTYVALRAIQHYLAFARMSDGELLRKWSYEQKAFSKDKQLQAFDDFVACRDKLKLEGAFDDSLLPYSVLVTEMATSWKFRRERSVDLSVIENRLRSLKERLNEAEGRRHRDWAERIITSIEEGIAKE
ncbi:hypothetical protein [Parvibaculum sp.]|uniref:hypothetical protein n=1 Tax=Parvibaculum sp. TaxID=2024848 RepID=UPI0034A0246B